MTNKPVLGLAGLFLAAGAMVSGCQNSPPRNPGMQGSRQPVVAGGNPNRGGSPQPQMVGNPSMGNNGLTGNPQPTGTGTPYGGAAAPQNFGNNQRLNAPLNMNGQPGNVHNVSGQPGGMGTSPVVPAVPNNSAGRFPSSTPPVDNFPLSATTGQENFGPPIPARPLTSHHTVPPSPPPGGPAMPGSPSEMPPLPQPR